MSLVPALSYCARMVHDQDRDRFITALFAPSERREALMALYAFNLEIARIRESVRDPMAGMIRLQWWRDTLAQILDGGEGADRHPVVQTLAPVIRGMAAAPDLLERLLSARERDLDAAGPADLEAALVYAADSSGAVVELALHALGVTDAAAHAAGRDIGIAWALVGWLRALPFHLSMGRLTLPEDLLRQAGTTGEAVLAGKAPAEQLSDVARILGEEAARRLASARKHAVGRSALPALLGAVLADAYLARLKASGWNCFDTRHAQSHSRPIALTWASWRGRF